MERRKSSTRIRAAITNDLLSFLGDSLVRWLVVHQFTSEAFTGLLKLNRPGFRGGCLV